MFLPLHDIRTRERPSIFSLSYVLSLLLAVISFLLFSTAFNPNVNSDHAINVLMADSFELPRDVYWWGQDRLGSLVPLISQVFIKGFHLSPVFSVSITNYLLFTLGFVGFSRLFRKPSTIILFAILWFFPYERYIDSNVFPLGISYSVLGISLLFLLRIRPEKHPFSYTPNLLYTGCTAFTWLCAVWVSDLIFITLTIFGVLALFYTLLHRKSLPFNPFPHLLVYGLVMIGIALTILKLKSYAGTITTEYASLNNFSEITMALGMAWSGIWQVLSFDDYFFIVSGGWCLSFMLLLSVIYLFRNRKALTAFRNFWIVFFLVDFIAILAVIFLSHWALMNQLGRWYFVAPYISGILLFLNIADRWKPLSQKKVVVPLFVGAALVGFSPISILSKEGRWIPQSRVVAELNALGEIGIIGEFWHSYNFSFVHPEIVKSTPYEHGGVRLEERIGEVFEQPNLYVCSDFWLDSFPEHLYQFGLTLQKDGNPFFLANATFCKYTIRYAPDSGQEFAINQFKFASSALQDSTLVFNHSTIIQHPVPEIYGPYCTLLPGTYELRYYCELSDTNLLKLNKHLLLDMCSAYGKNQLQQVYLTEGLFDTEEGCFRISFRIEHFQQQVEFRLFMQQKINFSFRKAVLKRHEYHSPKKAISFKSNVRSSPTINMRNLPVASVPNKIPCSVTPLR